MYAAFSVRKRTMETCHGPLPWIHSVCQLHHTLGVLPKISFKMTQSLHVALGNILILTANFVTNTSFLRLKPIILNKTNVKTYLHYYCAPRDVLGVKRSKKKVSLKRQQQTNFVAFDFFFKVFFNVFHLMTEKQCNKQTSSVSTCLKTQDTLTIAMKVKWKKFWA